MRNSKSKLDDEVDSLFTLPLGEFIAARKALAVQLKKDKRANEAEYVNTLTKPSISAWTVNQLYWNYRDEFDDLIEAGQRFRKAQSSRSSGKVAEMRDALDARREALAELSDLATMLLTDAGHNPSLDTIRRITTTLEAVSAYASSDDGPTPGRLTKDIDPPGFESLASFVPGAGTTKRGDEPLQVTSKRTASRDVNRVEETRQAKIAAAKVALQELKKSLANARARTQALEASLKKTDAEAKLAENHRREAEKQRREAEQRFRKASMLSEEATRRARTMKAEIAESTKAVEDAKRAVEKATKELELLFRQSK
ncbi:MAG TPA: hypothetical protein VLA93_19995 [Pyrinomonadaceae bacterium]|nr:hypothetical protein [Pyrinomonadaceae bacterium]